MKFRKAVFRRNGTDGVLPQTLTEAVDLALCAKPEGYSYHKLKCLYREWSECGVSKLELLPEEISEGSTEEVTWKRYEYVETGKVLSYGQEKKKIALVTKKTAPRELCKYFQDLLKEYPYHSFMAKWQSEQFNNLTENLPLNEIVCVHEYFEGYSCHHQSNLMWRKFLCTTPFYIAMQWNP